MKAICISACAGLALFLFVAPSSAQGGWAPGARLLPAEGYGTTDNHFGASFAVRENQALVGSPGIDGELGRAYLFERVGASWTQQASWTSTELDDDFGSAVALSEDTIVVGAPEYLDASGSVHILALQNGEWIHADALGLSAPESGARLGASVAVKDDTAFIGSPGSGGVHVLERAAGTWFYAGQLLPSMQIEHGFGAALAFDGARVLVGVPEDDAVHVFERSGLPAGSGVFTVAWVETARLVPPAGEFGHFGQTVSLLGNEALVGAPEDSGEGAAFLFERQATGWIQTAMLTPSDAPLGSEFGEAVALGQGLALVGAPADEVDPGVAYVFKRRESGWSQVGRLVPDVGPGEVSFGYDVAITGSLLLVNVGLDDSPIFGGLYAGSVQTWEPSKELRRSAGPGASVILRR